MSEPFEVLCEIRQGCPFSPLAFVLAVELLAITIRNSSIAGFETPDLGSRAGANMSIKQLTDDTALFLKNKQDMNISFTIQKEFECFTGLTLNIPKTKALQICSKREHENLPFKVIDKIKILRIYFENDKMANEIENNWNSKLE